MTAAVTISYERRIDQDLEEAYAWLTDFQEGDPHLTGAVLEAREIVSRTEDRVSMDETLAWMGLERTVRTVVELDPPDHWTAELHTIGAEAPDVVDHLLAPAGEHACTLTVEHRFAAASWFERLMLTVLKPWLQRDVRRLWDGLVLSLEQELSAEAAGQAEPGLDPADPG